MLLSFCCFTLAVSAAEHTHDWELVNSTLVCECGTQIVIDDDNLLCEHEFDYFEDEYNHGDKCLDCGYAVLVPHNFIDMGFEDGFHITECKDCNLTVYHSIIEWADEIGHHIKCEICDDKVDTVEHSEYNMNLGILNENFHYYECSDCGFIKCHTHTGDICECGFTGECLHRNAIITKIDDYEHLIECPDCGFSDSESHFWEDTSEYSTVSEIPVYCSSCHHRGIRITEYGILLSCKEYNGDYISTILTNGMKHHYTSWKIQATPGSFIRVRSVYGDCTSIAHQADFELLENLDTLDEYLVGSLGSKYSEETTLDSITVSKVIYQNDEFAIEFKDGNIVNFTSSELVVYNMTTSSMDTVEENDMILYFNPNKESKTIILIIG